MSKKKVLYIVHNHPSVRPGGGEGYALELYEAMRESSEFTPIFLAKGGPPVSSTPNGHAGTLVGRVNNDPNQYFFYAPPAFDWFTGVLRTKEPITRYFREFLEAIRPDVVHFQHTIHLGYDMILEVRKTLPRAAILYTLHEFLPICHRNGQLLRAVDNTPCLEPSPLRCSGCFPQHSPQDFFLRKKFVQSHFAHVDLFISPSKFLLERYVDWGIGRDRIVQEENGRSLMTRLTQVDAPRPRNRFAFFGQISPYKGLDLLLEAMRILGERQRQQSETDADLLSHSSESNRPHLRIYGANLDIQEASFQTRVRALLEQTRDNVVFPGRYDLRQLPSLMAEIDWVIIPSIWWENSPLVIQEAFAHRRPVICSNIGGMAEKVRNGIDGLHFAAGDALNLADTIERAATTPSLWDSVVAGIRDPLSISEHSRILEAHYHRLLAKQSNPTLQ